MFVRIETPCKVIPLIRGAPHVLEEAPNVYLKVLKQSPLLPPEQRVNALISLESYGIQEWMWELWADKKNKVT